jgi:hypothetical protein
MVTLSKYLAPALLRFLFVLYAVPLAALTGLAQNLPTELRITVVQGEGATNQVRQPVASEPAVRILDENQRPVQGATVVFTLPTDGASGRFANGAKMLVVTTDMQGRAAAAGLRVNEYPGKLVILVGVSYRGLSARTNITQFNEGPPVPAKAQKGGHGKLILILAGVGAAAAGGAAYFLSQRNGSSGASSSSSTPIGITAGTATIIGPH